MISSKCLIFYIVLLFHLINSILVRTKEGILRGNIKTVGSVTIYQFLGIPYAKPPVGELRFRKAQAIGFWNDIRNATDYGPTCIQPDENTDALFVAFAHPMLQLTSRARRPARAMSEDCLYLNVWTNQLAVNASWEGRPASSSSSSQRPVMVWVHGGNLVTGSTNIEAYNGAYLASTMDVVVVSLQYRLGPLGFLYLNSDDDDDVPGNQGLTDQLMGLQWIRNNIARFGGNPSQVTLVGQGGGALSIGLHLVSPLSGTLFQQAILQSGSPLAWWAVDGRSEALNKARMLASMLQCSSPLKGVAELVELTACLRSLDARLFKLDRVPAPFNPMMQNFNYDFQLYYARPMLFSFAAFNPVVGTSYLSDWPRDLLVKATEANNQPIRQRVMLGVNKDEFSNVLVRFNNDDVLDTLIPKHVLQTTLQRMFTSELLLNATMFEYQFPAKPSGYYKAMTGGQMHSLVDVLGDHYLKCPLIELADFWTNSGDNDQLDTGIGLSPPRRSSQVFLYSFEHQTKALAFPNWHGAFQGLESDYLFGLPFNDAFQREFYNFTSEEANLSRQMMQFWTNFASTGSPNLNPGEYHTRNQALHWDRYQIARRGTTRQQRDQSDRRYMVFSTPNSRMSSLTRPSTLSVAADTRNRQTNTDYEFETRHVQKPKVRHESDRKGTRNEAAPILSSCMMHTIITCYILTFFCHLLLG